LIRCIHCRVFDNLPQLTVDFKEKGFYSLLLTRAALTRAALVLPGGCIEGWIQHGPHSGKAPHEPVFFECTVN
jgi:hypothetical protein